MSSKTYVGIVMVGAAPRFYKTNTTQDLVYAGSYGQFPARKQSCNILFLRLLLPLDNLRVCFNATSP